MEVQVTHKKGWLETDMRLGGISLSGCWQVGLGCPSPQGTWELDFTLDSACPQERLLFLSTLHAAGQSSRGGAALGNTLWVSLQMTGVRAGTLGTWAVLLTDPVLSCRGLWEQVRVRWPRTRGVLNLHH
jgi:hypothetical protein